MPGLKVKYLRCEYKVDPAGIDVISPRLSWIVDQDNTEHKWLKQTAYQILVSSSLNNLLEDIGDIWDSGKVISGESCNVNYAGAVLHSAAEYWWKVKVWSDDITSAWSTPGKWITGILHDNEWKAKWIGFGEYRKVFNSKIKYKFDSGDKWIWLPHGEFSPIKDFNKVSFHHSFNIENITSVKEACLLVTADEGFKFYLNDSKAAESDGLIFSWTRPSFANILPLLRDGNNVIHVDCINSYLDTPGLVAKIFITMNGGTETIINTNEDWNVLPVEKNNIPIQNIDEKRNVNASVVASMGDKPWRTPHYELFLPPPPYFREEFKTGKNIKHAFLFVSALGIVKCSLNGKNITEDMFVPGWTDYNKRVYYHAYDIKEFLKTNNCLGVILADGWYAGYIGWEKHREYYGENPCFILQLKLEYEDGTNEYVLSDDSWKAAYGPIREADILMGEKYDAVIEDSLKGWNEPGFNEDSWNQVQVEEKKVELNNYPGEPVRKIMKLKPRKITSPRKDVYIFDLGQNIAGCVKLKIDGRKTKSVTLRFGEMLNENGELYTDNIRMARATDTYVTKGDNIEIWQPNFTYHGFRYIELTGYTETPDKDMITGIVLHSDIPRAGLFTCSNEKINKLYSNILWSQRANYFDIPTDCPQRDERLGWTADAIDFFVTAAYNMDVSAFYTKWLQDLNDAQEPGGAYTAIAPQPDLGVGPLYAGAAGWADAGIITPYLLYMFYGDTFLLKKYYPNMIKYMKYLEKNSKDYLRPDFGYGDWLSINADTPKDLISTAFYAYDAKIMSEIARIINKPDDTEKYSMLFNNIKTAFNRAYVKPDLTIKSNTQTAYALALKFGLVDDREKAIHYLVEDIKDRGYHVSAGFIGLTYLLPLLTEYGYSDVAYKILFNETYPSWMDMINNGATTMWERWDSYSPANGIYDPLMNSFNHTSLGVVGEWLYSVVGGISPLEPGFKKIKIKPEPGGNITFARTSYISVYGKISTSWEIKDDIFNLDVCIPFNTLAEVYLLKKNGKLLSMVPECILSEDEKYYIINIGSGEYRFKQEQGKNKTD